MIPLTVYSSPFDGVGNPMLYSLQAVISSRVDETTPEEVAWLDSLSNPVHEYPYYTYDPEMGDWIKH